LISVSIDLTIEETLDDVLWTVLFLSHNPSCKLVFLFASLAVTITYLLLGYMLRLVLLLQILKALRSHESLRL